MARQTTSHGQHIKPGAPNHAFSNGADSGTPGSALSRGTPREARLVARHTTSHGQHIKPGAPNHAFSNGADNGTLRQRAVTRHTT